MRNRPDRGEFLHGLGAAVPEVLGRWTTPRGSGVLLADVAGQDHYHAGPAVVSAVADRLVDLQVTCAARRGELGALGVPAAGDESLLARAERLLPRIGADLSPGERAAAERFVADLPARLATIAEGGLPVTLVHGDAHPGNARGPARAPTLLDWGDSGVGQPARDLAISWRTSRRQTRRACSPGSPPAGATPCRAATPPERPYHDGDLAAGLRTALRRLPA